MEQKLLTFREQRSLHPVLVGSCCSCRSIICVHVLARFQLKTLFGLNLLPYILQGVLVWLMSFVFTCIYWYPTRFPYHMMFVSLNSNMAGVISEAGTACLSGAPQFTRGF